MKLIKKGVRIFALDDSPFNKNEKVDSIIGVVGRENIVEGVITFEITIDGDDGTEKLIEAIKKSRFRTQIRVVVMNGIALAGLNVIDVEKVSRSLNLPVMMLTRTRPRRTLFNAALKKSNKGNYKKKVNTINRVYKNIKIYRKNGFYVQIYPSEVDVQDFVYNGIEFLRLANMIASGVKRGESRGRI